MSHGIMDVPDVLVMARMRHRLEAMVDCNRRVHTFIGRHTLDSPCANNEAQRMIRGKINDHLGRDGF